MTSGNCDIFISGTIEADITNKNLQNHETSSCMSSIGVTNDLKRVMDSLDHVQTTLRSMTVSYLNYLVSYHLIVYQQVCYYAKGFFYKLIYRVLIIAFVKYGQTSNFLYLFQQTLDSLVERVNAKGSKIRKLDTFDDASETLKEMFNLPLKDVNEVSTYVFFKCLH